MQECSWYFLYYTTSRMQRLTEIVNLYKAEAAADTILATLGNEVQESNKVRESNEAVLKSGIKIINRPTIYGAILGH